MYAISNMLKNMPKVDKHFVYLKLIKILEIETQLQESMQDNNQKLK